MIASVLVISAKPTIPRATAGSATATLAPREERDPAVPDAGDPQGESPAPRLSAIHFGDGFSENPSAI